MPEGPAIDSVAVNGVEMYAEVRGRGGTPMVVVHGGFATELAILPATTHYDIFGSPRLGAVVADFFD